MRFYNKMFINFIFRCNIIKKYRQLTDEQQGAIENSIDYYIKANKKDETTENGEDPFANKVG